MKHKIVATTYQIKKYQHKNIGIINIIDRMRWLFWTLTKLEIYGWDEVAAFLKKEFLKISNFYGLILPLTSKITVDKNHNFRITINNKDVKSLNLNKDFLRTLEYLLTKIGFNRYRRNLKITICTEAPPSEGRRNKYLKHNKKKDNHAMQTDVQNKVKLSNHSGLKKHVNINYQQRRWMDRIHDVAQEVRKNGQPIVVSPTSLQKRKIIHQIVAQYKVLTSKTIRTGEKNQAITIEIK